jgi:MYXO-CTERM domain-containing protein
MGELGAWQAFNLDGGGSSSMWRAGVGYVNDPSDGPARAVMNHLGVFAGSASGSAADPGSCYVAGGCFPTRVAGAEGELFEDLPRGALGYDAAAILFRAGITNGCRQTPRRFFCPSCATTRRQFVVMLIKAAGIPHPPVSGSSFTDVPADDWALRYIEAAAREGITSGCGTGVFCPDDPVTRGQAAAFIKRATGWPATRPATPTFADVPTTHVFYGAIETMVDRCVTNGCGSGNYCPGNPVTRAQTAVFLAKAFDLEDYNSCFDVTTTPTPGPEPEPEPEPEPMPTPGDGGGLPSLVDAGAPGPDAGGSSGRPDPRSSPDPTPASPMSAELSGSCAVGHEPTSPWWWTGALLLALGLQHRRRSR